MTETTKNTGIYYLGSIPKNWKVAKYGRFTVNRMGETILASDTVDQGIPVYSATQDDSIFGYVNETNLLLKKGDFVIPARGNSIGCVSVVKEEKATCSQTTICSRNIHDINNKFLYYCVLGLKSEWFRYEGSAIPQITVEQVKSNYLAYPSQEEQARIADFLDKKVSEIDAVISKTKESIEEYKKLKQSIITEAVTKGLDPNAEMKDSGVEWIGSIPRNWTCKKSKSISCRIVVGVVIKPADYFDDNGKVPFLRGINVKEYSICPDPMVYISEETNKLLEKSIIHTNDLLIVRDGSIGTTCLVPADYDGSNVVSMIVLTCDQDILPQYLCYSFNSNVGKTQFNLTKIGTALTHTSVNAVSNILHMLPPYEEQLNIVKYLDNQCFQYDTLIANKEQVIAELEQYKKSLIYEYVTGKKEVLYA